MFQKLKKKLPDVLLFCFVFFRGGRGRARCATGSLPYSYLEGAGTPVGGKGVLTDVWATSSIEGQDFLGWWVTL